MSGGRLAIRDAWRSACVAVLALALAGGCTARQGYEGLRAGARNDCALQPASEYQRCLQRLEMDYAAYRTQPLPPGTEPTAPPVSRAPSPDADAHAIESGANGADAGDPAEGQPNNPEGSAQAGADEPQPGR